MDIKQLQADSRFAWLLVIVASLLMGLGAGALISISAFLKPISADFGWLRGETSFAYMAGATAMGIGGIAMGYVSDRYSTRPVVLMGTLCLGGALLLLATQTSLWQFYLYYCILGGLGSAALDAPLLANVGNWFHRNKGLALGIALAGRALGQGLIPFIAGFLIVAHGWREAYAILGIMCIVIMLPLALILRNPPGLAEAKEASRRASASELQAAYPVSPKLAVAWLKWCRAVLLHLHGNRDGSCSGDSRGCRYRCKGSCWSHFADLLLRVFRSDRLASFRTTSAESVHIGSRRSARPY